MNESTRYSVKGHLRRKRRARNAKMNDAQVRAAYALYRNGMSLMQIALAIWQKYGYSSPITAENSLKKAFYLNGYKLRSRSDACRLHKHQFYGTTTRSRENGKITREYGRLNYQRRHGGLQPTCEVPTTTGIPCQNHRQRGKVYCYAHDPARAEERSTLALIDNARRRLERTAA